jgi:hypothetical protein
MVDLLLLLLIVIQATVDISRERQWKGSENHTRINRKGLPPLLLPFSAGFLLVLGKFYFEITGLPTIGLIALYLLMLFYFMHAYPYIILKDEEAYICTHALQPNITIPKDQITSAQKNTHMIHIEYEVEHFPVQRVILDTRSFPDIVHLESWLGLHKKPYPMPESKPTSKKAA